MKQTHKEMGTGTVILPITVLLMISTALSAQR